MEIDLKEYKSFEKHSNVQILFSSKTKLKNFLGSAEDKIKPVDKSVILYGRSDKTKAKDLVKIH